MGNLRWGNLRWGKTQAPKYLIKGEHRWQWDGYDNEDIFLDTAN